MSKLSLRYFIFVFEFVICNYVCWKYLNLLICAHSNFPRGKPASNAADNKSFSKSFFGWFDFFKTPKTFVLLKYVRYNWYLIWKDPRVFYSTKYPAHFPMFWNLLGRCFPCLQKVLTRFKTICYTSICAWKHLDILMCFSVNLFFFFLPKVMIYK